MGNTPRIIDLTHTLSSAIPHWDQDCCFRMETACDYKDCTPPNVFRTQKLNLKAGSGTHIDAPAHCFPSATTTDKLDLQNLSTHCIVIKAKENADARYLVMPEEIEAFEKAHGVIPANAFVIFYTGWDKYWNDPKKYRNDLQFPSVHESTAKLLLQRNIVGIGIDTLSPDAGGKDFPVHRALLGAGKYIVENVANAGVLPPTGAKVMVMPMKIKDGTEAPVRLVAILP